MKIFLTALLCLAVLVLLIVGWAFAQAGHRSDNSTQVIAGYVFMAVTAIIGLFGLLAIGGEKHR